MIKTTTNVGIRLGNYKGKTKKELEKISKEFNDVHALRDTKAQDEPLDV